MMIGWNEREKDKWKEDSAGLLSKEIIGKGRA